MSYTPAELSWIALSILLISMNKGGFPIGVVALPLLILMWPGSHDPARTAVAFMLPLLCLMDVCALGFYRRHILWRRVVPLFPGMVAGVVVASVLFVSKEGALLAVSDRWIKLSIGVLGLLFVLYQGLRRQILSTLETKGVPGPGQCALFGFGTGITSTLAHAAGPIMRMYLLPQHLGKMNLAGTTVGYFFVLNLVKMVPFAALGRIEKPNLLLGAALVPVIPVGVLLGYVLVRITNPRYYIAFIYAMLFFTSCMLIYRALG